MFTRPLKTSKFSSLRVALGPDIDIISTLIGWALDVASRWDESRAVAISPGFE